MLRTTLLLIFLVTLNACQHEVSISMDTIPSGVACSKDSVYFQNRILPLLVSTCAMSTCHNTQYHTLNFDMTTYEGVLKLVRPKSVDGSALYTALINLEMPISPAPIWTDAQMLLLKTWIEQGALNNTCNESYSGCDTTKITYTNFIQPLVTTYCKGCHIQKSWGGNIILNTFEDVKTVAKTGQLYGCLAQKTGFSAMPKFQKPLSECTINKIQVWIKSGMLQ